MGVESPNAGPMVSKPGRVAIGEGSQQTPDKTEIVRRFENKSRIGQTP